MPSSSANGRPGRGPLTVALVAAPARRIRFNISGIYPLPPLGLALLAELLRGAGHRVWLLDPVALRLSGADLARALADRPPPDLVAIGATLFSAPGVEEVSRASRALWPDARVVLGGPIGVASAAGLLRRFPAVDYLIQGEGEEGLPALVAALKSEGDLDAVPGLVRRGEQGPLRNRRASWRHLDHNPPPALDLLPMGRYRMHPPFGGRRPVALLETARGCESRCSFCTLPRVSRARSADHVAEEVRWLVEQHDVRELHLVDPTFSADRERALLLCEAIGRAADGRLSWTCKTRADSVDPALLAQMAAAGCTMVSYGLESGDSGVLELLGKGLDLERSRAAIAATRAAGMRTIAYFMVGCPGDTDQTVRKTRDLARSSGADFVLFGELLPDPDSALAHQAMREGRIEAGAIERFYLDEDDGPFRDIAFGGQPRAQVRRWVRQSYLSAYGNPRYAARRLASLDGPREVGVLASGAWHLAKDALRPSRY